MRRGLIVWPLLATLALGGCGRDALPQGEDFASLDAPVVRLGLEAFRRGDGEGMVSATEALTAIARDEAAIGGDPCSREALAARDAARAVQLLQTLAQSGFLHDSEDARFVVLGDTLNTQNRDRSDDSTCAFAAVLRLEQIFPAVLPRADDAPLYFYAVWRDQMAARLGRRFEDVIAAAETRVWGFSPRIGR